MNADALYTLFYKEVLRFLKVWLQTVFAPVVTALLFLLIFGELLQGRLEVYAGVGYAQFLLPGLMMMSIIQNAFANSSSSMIQSKVTGNIVFILVSPLSPLEVFIAFVAAAVVRGLLVGLAVYLIVLPFLPLGVHNLAVLLVFAVLGAAVLGALGLIAGIWADKFDQLAGFQNFVIVPLSFLSGVFYSIHSLPPIWQQLSHLNPFFYMVDGFRYGFFGASDVSPALSFSVSLLSLLAIAAVALAMLRAGYKLRD